MRATPQTSLGPRQAPLGSAKVHVLVVLFALLGACQQSSEEHLTEAREALAGASYDAAITAVDAGLAASPGKADAWALELVKLEAHARSGDGAGAKQQLAALAGSHPGQLSANDYSSTAQQLKAAGQGPAAIEVLDLGKQAYPDDELIAKMIAELVEAQSSPEELEMLKSLGYIE